MPLLFTSVLSRYLIIFFLLIFLLSFSCNYEYMYEVSVRRGFLFLLVFGMGCVILLWCSLVLR